METARVVLYHVIRSSADMCHCCWQPPPRSPHLSAVTCRPTAQAFICTECMQSGGAEVQCGVCVCVCSHRTQHKYLESGRWWL